MGNDIVTRNLNLFVSSYKVLIIQLQSYIVIKHLLNNKVYKDVLNSSAHKIPEHIIYLSYYKAHCSFINHKQTSKT